MKVENGRLIADPRLVDMSQRWAPGRGVHIRPTHIIIHYDVCHTLAENSAAQFESGLYYHVAVDGYDHDQKRVEVRQYIPFDRRGNHSLGCNDWSIGLVIVNPGPLIPDSKGVLRTVHGRVWDPQDALKCEHRSGLAPKSWQHWCAYSYEERDTVIDICAALCAAYPSIKTICGHDYLSPGRKFDPGPAADDAILAPLRGALPDIYVPEVETAA